MLRTLTLELTLSADLSWNLTFLFLKSPQQPECNSHQQASERKLDLLTVYAGRPRRHITLRRQEAIEAVRHRARVG